MKNATGYQKKLKKLLGDMKKVKAILVSTAVLSGLYIVVNFFWLLPALTSQGGYLESIGVADLYGFAPEDTTGMGVEFSLASMHGFWRGGYTYASDLLPGWYLIFFVVLLLSILGFLYYCRDKGMGWKVIGIAAGSVVAFILALGVSSSATEESARWLFDSVPFMRGFRDSQKFVAVLVLSYSFLGGLGVDRLLSGLEKRRIARSGVVAKVVLLVIILILPLLYSFPMFWGFGGQLHTTDYPEDWYEADEYFESHPGDYTVLFLPWHMYMDFGFAGTRLANPAESFFTPNILQSADVEMGGIHSDDPARAYVQFLIDNGDRIEDMGSYLSLLNVRYVILAKEVDYLSYSFLLNQTDLAVISNSTHLYILENKAHTSILFSVDRVNSLPSLEDLLPLENVTGGAFRLEGTSNIGQWNTSYPLHSRLSEVEYEVTDDVSGNIVFVPTNYDPRYWRVKGGETDTSLDFAVVYNVTGSDQEIGIKYARFDTYLSSYSISLVAAFALTVYYVWRFDTRMKRFVRSVLHSVSSRFPR